MANSIYILCCSSAPLTYGEIEDYMGHMGFLDEPATFVPPVDASNRGDAQWASFELWFHPDRRPIQVSHWMTRDELEPTLEELREQIADDAPEDVAGVLLERLDRVHQAVAFEFGLDPPRDVWEMLDATEAYLASTYDGIIVASEGIYDAQLKPIVTWQRPGGRA
jgi:hypothetical protein